MSGVDAYRQSDPGAVPFDFHTVNAILDQDGGSMFVVPPGVRLPTVHVWRQPRASTLEAIASVQSKLGRDVFGNSVGTMGPANRAVESVVRQVVTENKPKKRLYIKRIKSYIDNDHGVEWIPIQSIGWPKRLIVLRGDAINDHTMHRLTEANLGDAYTGAPIVTMPSHGDIELYEVEE